MLISEARAEYCLVLLIIGWKERWRTRLAAIGAALLMSQIPAHAQLGEFDSKVGDWSILRKTDPMTDKPSCIAIFKDSSGIQLTSTSLAVLARGIRGYQMRFDDQAASQMQLPSNIEKEIGAVIWRDETFQRIIQSRRLRFQAVTYSGLENHDIDLSAVDEAINVLHGPRCS